MQIRTFTVPLADDGSWAAELNLFLRSHRVLEVDQEEFARHVQALAAVTEYAQETQFRRQVAHELNLHSDNFGIIPEARTA